MNKFIFKNNTVDCRSVLVENQLTITPVILKQIPDIMSIHF